MATLIQDLRLALRQARRRPGWTSTIILTLALGIGANTALFSIIRGVLLRPLPIQEPERVVQIWEELTTGWAVSVPHADIDVPIPNFQDYRERSRAVQHMTGLSFGRVHLVRDRAEEVTTLSVSPGFFPLFDVSPSLGRPFTAEEHTSRGQPAVMLTHDTWQSRFGGDPGVVGRSIELNQWWGGETGFQTIAFQVVGVLPRDMRLPPLLVRGDMRVYRPELVLPESWSWSWNANNRGIFALRILGRLAPGASVGRAQAELAAVAKDIEEISPHTHAGYSVRVTPLQEVLRSAYGRPLLILLTAVGFVLLIACANVANLLLARATTRHREFGVRAALGAGGRRLVRQMLTEGLFLAVLGGIGGMLIAGLSLRVALARFPGSVPRLEEVRLDPLVLGFALLLSTVTAVLFGLAPGWRAYRIDPRTVLRAGSATAARGRRGLLRALVVAEITLATALLVGAGLLLHSFVRLTNADTGFRMERTLMADVRLPPRALSKYSEGWSNYELFQRIIERVGSLPGASAVAGAQLTPWGTRSNSVEITVPGRDRHPAEEGLTMHHLGGVTPEYFRVMGIPVLAGSVFGPADISPDVSPRAVINRTMAARYWPGQDPIGKTYFWGIQDLETGERDDRYPFVEFTVIGVVGDVKATGPDATPEPQSYVPFGHGGDPTRFTLLVRADGDVATLSASIPAAIREVDPAELHVPTVVSMQERLGELVAGPRFYTGLAAAFASLAALLAVTGLYGVLSYAVSQRTREMGVRMALGATGARIRRLLLGDGLVLVLTGLLGGLALALAFGRVLDGLLFEVRITDPATLLVVPTLLLAAGLAASWLPALRASRVEPVEALRAE